MMYRRVYLCYPEQVILFNTHAYSVHIHHIEHLRVTDGLLDNCPRDDAWSPLLQAIARLPDLRGLSLEPAIPAAHLQNIVATLKNITSLAIVIGAEATIKPDCQILNQMSTLLQLKLTIRRQDSTYNDPLALSLPHLKDFRFRHQGRGGGGHPSVQSSRMFHWLGACRFHPSCALTLLITQERFFSQATRRLDTLWNNHASSETVILACPLQIVGSSSLFGHRSLKDLHIHGFPVPVKAFQTTDLPFVIHYHVKRTARQSTPKPEPKPRTEADLEEAERESSDPILEELKALAQARQSTSGVLSQVKICLHIAHDPPDFFDVNGDGAEPRTLDLVLWDSMKWSQSTTDKAAFFRSLSRYQGMLHNNNIILQDGYYCQHRW
jgi:hypothetical protein